MPHVLFVAPFLMPATVRFVQAAAGLEGVRLGLITQDPTARIPAALARRLAGHRQVDDCFDPDVLAAGARELATKIGGLDRMLGALEQLQVPLAEARARLGVEGMDPETANNFRDKARMKTVLRRAGLPCARHCLAASPQDAQRFAAEIGYPLVAKPPAGAGAKATYRLESDAALAETLAFARPAPGKELLLEEFVTGTEYSWETVTIGGQPVWHSYTRYIPSPLAALENPWIQWCVALPRKRLEPRLADIQDIATRSLAALGMRHGLTHMEWFRRSDGSIAVSEVAARPPGAQITALLAHAHEFDVLAAWARLMIFGEWNPPPRRWATGAAFLRGQGGGRVHNVLGLAEAQKELGELVVEVNLPRPGQPKSSSYEGEGYVVLRHSDTDTVVKALMRLVSLVRVVMEPA
jgi:hypothetical protein